MIVGFIDTVHPILNQLLEKKGVKCIDMHTLDYEQLVSKAAELDGIVIRSRFRMDEGFLQHASSLKFIARSGAGMENIDLGYCKKRNIVCFNSPEGNRDAVGEHAIGMLLSLMNRLKIADAEVRKGIWLREENRGYEMAGKTIGIIGYGMMGSAFAKKLQGFDCEVLAYDKYKKGFGSDSIKEVELEDIFRKCHIVSLHVPLTNETKYMVNERFIHSMQNEFYLINTARGQCVDTNALVVALKTGKIKGACLDVLEYEKSSFEKLEISSLPEPMQYLVQSEKVILSPHIAGWTYESYEKLSTFLANKIIHHFNL